MSATSQRTVLAARLLILSSLALITACRDSPTAGKGQPTGRAPAHSQLVSPADLKLPAGYTAPHMVSRRLVRVPDPSRADRSGWLWVTSTEANGTVVMKSARTANEPRAAVIRFADRNANVVFEQFEVTLNASGALPWIEWYPVAITDPPVAKEGVTQVRWGDHDEWKLVKVQSAEATLAKCAGCPKAGDSTWALDSNGIAFDIGTMARGGGTPNVYRVLRSAAADGTLERLWLDGADRPILSCMATSAPTVRNCEGDFCDAWGQELIADENVSVFGSAETWSEPRSIGMSDLSLESLPTGGACECEGQDCKYHNEPGICHCQNNPKLGTCICYCGPKVRRGGSGGAGAGGGAAR
ncbi:MAG: hypothetical protein JSR77_13630 [Planctomycetes bacterium]|nr:hypothetical protein [Planctomycetota bacterium]